MHRTCAKILVGSFSLHLFHITSFQAKAACCVAGHSGRFSFALKLHNSLPKLALPLHCGGASFFIQFPQKAKGGDCMCWRDYALALYRCGWSMGRAWQKVMEFEAIDDIDGLADFVASIETVAQMRAEDRY